MKTLNEKKWIQKAINPKHKGYCTPMTKATCTPRRKALAMRFKKGDLHQDSLIDRLIPRPPRLDEDEPWDVCPSCGSGAVDQREGTASRQCEECGYTWRTEHPPRRWPSDLAPLKAGVPRRSRIGAGGPQRRWLHQPG
jgi:hypothetical protein